MFFKKKKDNFYDNVPRRWGFMRTLDGYVFREFMLYFFVMLFVFIILFILGDVFNDLADFLSAKAKISSMLTYFILKLPGNIRFILPISILLACMWTMANFGKHMEVTAMRASGVSLFRCAGSVLVVGLIITGLTFWLNEKLIPYSEQQAETVFFTATNNLEKLMRKRNMLTYRSDDRTRTWLFNSFTDDEQQKNVMLKKYRDDGTLKWDIIAAKASHSPKRGWTFSDLTLTTYSKDGLMPKNPQKLKTLTKSVQEIHETPQNILDAIKAPEDLPSWVIWKLINNNNKMPQKRRAMYLSILFYRIAFPWACCLAVFLGIPLATKNERSGIFTAIISAVLIIVAYQVSSEICLVLGKRGVLNPAIAGLGPTICFIIFGWYNVIKQKS
jgi:lipopolysaccharide export system permease protein